MSAQVRGQPFDMGIQLSFIEDGYLCNTHGYGNEVMHVFEIQAKAKARAKVRNIQNIPGEQWVVKLVGLK